MKKLLFLLLMAALPMSAQQFTGTISATSTDCSVANSCLVVSLPANAGAVTASVSGTFAATLAFEATNTGGPTYTAISGQPLPSGTMVTTTTTTGTWQFNAAGFNSFRVRSSAYTSGTATVTLTYSTGSQLLIGTSMPNGLTYSGSTLTVSSAGNGNGTVVVSGTTSGTCSWAIDSTSTTITQTCANFALTGLFSAPANKAVLAADWTCGTGGTVASCVSATIIGSGGGVPLTFTLPLVAASWRWECNLIVGQATADTANQWNILTATTGATNVAATYDMYTAATAKAGGAVTGQTATTTTFQIAPSWTLGGLATKMPVRIQGSIEGASASGTVLSLQLVAPTVADLVTVYRGSECHVQ